MNDQAQAIQAIQNTSRGLIQQLQKESSHHQESNKRLTGQLQRYIDAYQTMKTENAQLKAANKSQDATIATLRTDNKTLNEQVRTLMNELNFLLSQAQMLSAEVATGDTHILDSTLLLDSIFTDHTAEAKPVAMDLSMDLRQTMTSYQMPALLEAAEPTVSDDVGSEEVPMLDLDAIEADLAEIEASNQLA